MGKVSTNKRAPAQASAANGRAGNFFSNGLRQKIDQLMDTLWAGGVNNPMDAVEQISYLLFLRLLTERDEQHAKISKKYERVFSGRWARYGWGNFVTLSGDALYNAVRDAIEKLYELPGLSSTGKLLFSRATLKIYDRPTLRATVQAIQGLDLEPHNGGDLKGDMYEYLLSRLTLSGRNGQFRTPRHIINMIVNLVSPKPGQRICDPACGTAGFLISAYNHILEQNQGTGKQNFPGGKLTPKQWEYLQEQAITGYDNDANMVKISILNLYLHQLEKANVEFHNPLTTPGSKSGGQYPGAMFDVILANPPFAGKVQDESILEDLNSGLNTRATELLFLKWFLDHLAPGGRAGVIVPNGVLFGSNKATKKVREILLSNYDLQAVVNLPSGVFKPYSGVGTAVLIFERPKTAAKDDFVTKSVWFYDLTADGFSLDDKRAPIDANDIPDILAKWPMREEGPNSYRVTIEKIRENDLSLAAGNFKQSLAGPPVARESPSYILSEVLRLEGEIIREGSTLRAAIGRDK